MPEYTFRRAEVETAARARNSAIGQLARDLGVTSLIIPEEKIAVTEADDKFTVTVHYEGGGASA